MPRTCVECGVEIEKGKYCSKQCYYDRNKSRTSPYQPLVDPITEQLAEEGIVVTGESDEFCDVCGSPKYQGRCSRFTQHRAPKKPKSR